MSKITQLEDVRFYVRVVECPSERCRGRLITEMRVRDDEGDHGLITNPSDAPLRLTFEQVQYILRNHKEGHKYEVILAPIRVIEPPAVCVDGHQVGDRFVCVHVPDGYDSNHTEGKTYTIDSVRPLYDKGPFRSTYKDDNGEECSAHSSSYRKSFPGGIQLIKLGERHQ